MDIKDAVPEARIIERHKGATPKTVIAREGNCVRVRNDAGRETSITEKTLKRYNLLEAPEPTVVVISRNQTHGRAGRVYVIQSGLPVFGDVDNKNAATVYLRRLAQELLDRGRWHGLDPRLEPAGEEA